MKITFCWDDGAAEDLKLMELHKEYSIPGIFFVPTYNREGRDTLSSNMIENSASELISFGCHTEHHVYLTRIPIDEVEQEIVMNKDYLQKILGKEVLNFCLPGGKYNKRILEIVYKHFKTIRTADTMCFTHSEDFIKPTFHMYDRGKLSLLYNGIRNGSYKENMMICRNMSFDYWDLIDYMLDSEAEKDDSYIAIWGHSWEIEQFGLWSEVERMFKHVAKQYHDDCVSYDKFCNPTMNEY